MTDRFTDAGAVTDTTRITGTRVADAAGVTQPSPKAAQDQRAKPTVENLFLWDSASLDRVHATALRDGLHARSTMLGVNNWDDLRAALGRYARIGTLVLFTHSIPGELLLGGSSPSASDAQRLLASVGRTVSSAIAFEGCEMLRDPVGAAWMFQPLLGDGAQMRGYTLYSVLNTLTVTIPTGADAATIAQQLRPHARYLLPGQPSPAQMAGKPGTYTLVQRWFRHDLDETAAPPLLPGDPPARDFLPRDSLGSRTIASAADARAAVELFAAPVPPAEAVTITNVPAVAQLH